MLKSLSVELPSEYHPFPTNAQPPLGPAARSLTKSISAKLRNCNTYLVVRVAKPQSSLSERITY